MEGNKVIPKVRLEIYEPEAATVRFIFDALAGGQSCWDIIRSFEARNIPAPRNGKWCPSTIGRMVRNESYIGKAYANRYEVIKRDGKRNQRIRPREEWIALPDGVFPAITDEATMMAAVRQIEKNRTIDAPRNNKNPEAFLLRGGYARCGTCGAALMAVNRKGNQPFYRCPYSCRSNDKRCPSFTITTAELDNAAWASVRLILDNPDWAKAYLREQATPDTTAADLEAVEAVLKDLAKQQRNYVENLGFVSGDSASLIHARLKEIEDLKGKAQARRASILARQENVIRAETVLDRIAAQSARVDAMTYAEKRAMLDAFGVRAYVWPKTAPERFVIESAFDLDAWAAEAGIMAGDGLSEFDGSPATVAGWNAVASRSVDVHTGSGRGRSLLSRPL